jgi:hydroxymethylpyrimidine pyrophosphatase-like HAD family hydrolase
MAAFFVDFDGTIALFGTETPLPGAIQHLRALVNAGHQVIITTARPRVTAIRAMLEKNGLSKISAIGGIQNPRVVINDMGAYGIAHPQDAAWDYAALVKLPVQSIVG